MPISTCPLRRHARWRRWCGNTASNLLFGGTANFLVAREFADLATYEQKLALMKCVFAVSTADSAISIAEESEIHRLAAELRIDQPDLIKLRVAHARHLPGVSRDPRSG
jgi:hypothetical protein